jgi:hypothetical protein
MRTIETGPCGLPETTQRTKTMPKTRINLSLDQDLADFAKMFAAENRTTFAEIVTQYLLSLKRKTEGATMETILSHPAFQEAMEEAQSKLRAGSAKWYSYEEVFDK